MADVLVKPAFVSLVADSGDTTKLGPNAWNAARLFSAGVDGDVPVRDLTAGTGAAWSSSKASSTPSLWFNYAAWGDSLTVGTGGTPYTTPLATSTGQSVYNGGVGGETSTQIKVRMLAATARLGNFTIIWAGRNNFNAPTVVKADIAAMVAALGHQRYLILSVLNQSVALEYSGAADYLTIVQLNADLAALYPDNYLDIRAYLVSQYNAGIPQDVIDFGRDVPPSSLRSDAAHLNTAGYAAVAARVQVWLTANDVVGRRPARLSDLLALSTDPPILSATAAIRWGSSGTSSPDVGLLRSGTQCIGMQNGTTSQIFEVFESYIDASNYSKLRVGARAGTDFMIYTQRNGSIPARPLTLGANGGLQWQIGTTGHFIALTDNTNDIGASGATRPRNIFAAGGITTGATTLHTTSVALTNGAAAAAGTLSNAPTAGNPTKWVPINDNGTTRYIPAW